MSRICLVILIVNLIVLVAAKMAAEVSERIGMPAGPPRVMTTCSN